MNKLYAETQSNTFMNRAQELVQRLNIPQQMQNDPHQIVNYLVQNGTVSQNRLNQVIQMAQRMGIKL